MNINIPISSSLKDLEIKIPSSSLSFNRNSQKEIKSLEKEQKFFNENFPKILSKKYNKVKTISDNLDKKIKGISLSVKTYNKYMIKYQNLLKYPSSNYYSTEKIKNFIPFKLLKNTNLNKKNNLYSTFNDFGKINQILTYNSDNTKNVIINQKKFISKTNYGNKDIWKFNEKKNEENNDKEILKYFIEGTFLSQPERIKDLQINEKIFHPHILTKADFIFYSGYLENLHKNENFTDIKSKEYEANLFQRTKLKFLLELRSLCLLFEEKNIKDINDNKDEPDNNDKKKNIQRIYLPFKYLPLFFLFSYSTLKAFIAEIITYDIESNKFNIKVNAKLEKIIKKYSQYNLNKINMYTLENNESAFKDILLYQNEYHFKYIFPWIIYDNRNADIKTKFFRLKIIFPTINFQPEEYGIRFQKYASKWLIFELVKKSFIFWDRYLLYNLFMNKKLRNTISYILNKKRNHISYEYTTKMVGPIIDDTIAKKNNFEFFVTEVLNNQNHYYFFTPYRATISSRHQNKYYINDSINLQLNDSRKIYKLARHFGLIATFNKFLLYNKLANKYYFDFKCLQDITQNYILLLKSNNKVSIVNQKYKQIFKYNGNEYQLLIRECLLCEKIINNYNYCELQYYKIPNDLLYYILENNINNDEIYPIFKNNSNKIINIEEIEEYREFLMNKNIYNDSSSSVSKTSKDKNKRKLKNNSNHSLKIVDISEKKMNEYNKLIQLSITNSNKKMINTNERMPNRLSTIINRKISDINDKLNIKNQKDFKKKTIILGRKSENFKPEKLYNNKIFIKNIDINKGNIENIHKENGNNELSKINNNNQFELMRIKREIKFPSYDNDFEKLRFNLNNNNY